MKLIKILVSLALINAVIVVLLVSNLGQEKAVLPDPTTSSYQSGFGIDTYERTVVTQTPEPTLLPIASATRTNMPTPIPSIEPIPSAVVSPTPSPTPIPATATPTPTPTPTPTGCIVTIDGVKYNVDSLRKTHSGGDIFVCGTDMSVTFWNEHNSRILSKMQKYKI